jgi:hypothetical protein
LAFESEEFQRACIERLNKIVVILDGDKDDPLASPGMRARLRDTEERAIRIENTLLRVEFEDKMKRLVELITWYDGFKENFEGLEEILTWKRYYKPMVRVLALGITLGSILGVGNLVMTVLKAAGAIP